jgi:hypothetical protein
MNHEHIEICCMKTYKGIAYNYLVLLHGSSVKYLQNICTKVSVTYLQHIGIWPHNISVTDIWQISVTVMW